METSDTPMRVFRYISRDFGRVPKAARLLQLGSENSVLCSLEELFGSLLRDWRRRRCGASLRALTRKRKMEKKKVRNSRFSVVYCDLETGVPVMSASAIESFLIQRMDSAVDVLRKELSNIRAGRPTSSILDQVIVSSTDGKQPLPRFAQVIVKDSNTLTVNVFDKSVC